MKWADEKKTDTHVEKKRDGGFGHCGAPLRLHLRLLMSVLNVFPSRNWKDECPLSACVNLFI